MQCIVAVDKNWGIGYKNQLLVSIPADMRFFKEMTTGKVVVMGKNTLESFPGGKPLANRTNIVVALEKDYKVPGATVVNSIEEAVEVVKEYNQEDVIVIGGASIYKQFLPYCDVAHVTKIDYAYEADTYFPNLDVDEDWEITADSEEQTYYDLEYRFVKYERISTRI
jgi:dihydrofolate reductase